MHFFSSVFDIIFYVCKKAVILFKLGEQRQGIYAPLRPLFTLISRIIVNCSKKKGKFRHECSSYAHKLYLLMAAN